MYSYVPTIIVKLFKSFGENRAVYINPLKPACYATYQQFNIQQLYILPKLSFCVLYLSENSDFCHFHHKLIGFNNRVEKCLQRGTNWVSKLSSLRFVFKRLKVKGGPLPLQLVNPYYPTL
jgi:hypothetical protein